MSKHTRTLTEPRPSILIVIALQWIGKLMENAVCVCMCQSPEVEPRPENRLKMSSDSCDFFFQNNDHDDDTMMRKVETKAGKQIASIRDLDKCLGCGKLYKQ